MFRYWNRIIKMDPNRITKKVFTWDFVKKRCVGSWNSDIVKLFSSLNMGNTNIYHNSHFSKGKTVGYPNAPMGN